MVYTDATRIYLDAGEGQDITRAYWISVLDRAGSFSSETEHSS